MQKESIRSIFLKTAEHDRTTDVTRKELFDMTFVCRLKIQHISCWMKKRSMVPLTSRCAQTKCGSMDNMIMIWKTGMPLPINSSIVACNRFLLNVPPLPLSGSGGFWGEEGKDRICRWLEMESMLCFHAMMIKVILRNKVLHRSERLSYCK